jgi:transposase
MQSRKRYTSEEKTKILRDLIDNNLLISTVAEKNGLHPNIIYRWKKQMLEGAPETLSNGKKKSDKQLQEAEKEIAELKAKLSQRDALIVELVEDNIYLKKKTGGEISTKNGLSRR